jgi:hypothetical protein
LGSTVFTALRNIPKAFPPVELSFRPGVSANPDPNGLAQRIRLRRQSAEAELHQARQI